MSLFDRQLKQNTYEPPTNYKARLVQGYQIDDFYKALESKI